MFRKSTCHLQPILISTGDELPEKHSNRLENSWAEVFYRETFSRLDERPSGVPYADCPSRLNFMVGLETA